MKSHPRNEGTSKVDMILLFAMPGIVAALTAAIAYLGLLTNGG